MTDLKKQALIETVYIHYYNEYPEFTKENITLLTIEIQSMFFLLQHFGSAFSGPFSDFSYNTLKDYQMPISMELQDTIVSIINSEKKPDMVKLKEEAFAELFIIKTVITEKLKHVLSREHWLQLIPAVIYSQKYMLPTATDKKIAKFNKCRVEDVTAINNLALEIEQNIEAYYEDSKLANENIRDYLDKSVSIVKELKKNNNIN